MGESEKGKERLRAMHVGAVQSEFVDGHFSSAAPIHLLNPLIQPSATPPGAEKSSPASRFDYYTNPMSAYSGNKRSVTLGHQPPDNFSPPIRSSSLMAHLSSPSSGQGRHYMIPTCIPVNHLQVSYSQHRGTYMTSSPVPQYGLWRSPAGMAGRFSGNNSVNMPGMQDRCVSTSGCGLPQNASRCVFASSGFGRGVISPSANSGGRGSPSASSGEGSPSANSRRGRVWQSGNYQSPFSGKSSRGRQGSNDFALAHQKPELFFHKPMVEDPWDKLEPVVGHILEPPVKQMTPDSKILASRIN